MNMNRPPWCDSKVEEALGTLTLIAAFIAYGVNLPRWIFWFLLIKALSDHYLAVRFAIRDIRAEAGSAQPPQTTANGA